MSEAQLKQARREAFEWRRKMRERLDGASQELSVSRISDRATATADPGYRFLEETRRRVLDHPLLSIIILTGLYGLVRDWTGPHSRPTRRRRLTPDDLGANSPRLSSRPTMEKEMSNGHEHSINRP